MLDILDTAGQEEFSAMRDSYFRLGDGFLIVYSVSDKPSFESVATYHTKILRVKECAKFPMVICANKADVPTEERVVTKAEGEVLAKNCKVPYLETSARLKMNVEEAFFTLVREIKASSKEVSAQQAENQVTRITKEKKKCTLL
eukprot:TRINITY_DN1245_c0_g1_i1.p1 TRINITY_DN1245_c0_g1~~TRINITY_DN1245_c0_g1_i1.p1  ORF type:complete len:144 (+),score=48.57 TRINITY_DN1245_c0_g1_i1:304-735(+)